jgi:hypothetical protein
LTAISGPAPETEGPVWFSRHAVPTAALALGLLLTLNTSVDFTRLGRIVCTALVLVIGLGGLAMGWLRIARPALVHWALLAVYTTILIACIFSIDREYSFKAFTRQHLWFLALVPAVAALAGYRIVRHAALGGLTAACLVSASAGLWLYGNAEALEAAGRIRNAGTYVWQAQDDQGRPYKRARGLLKSYTRSAFIYIIALPAVLVLAMEAARHRCWWLVGLAVLAALISLLYMLATKSRGAWLGTGIALLVTYLMRGGRWWHPVVAIMAVIVVVLALPQERARAATMVRHLTNPDLLLSRRIELWSQGLTPIRENLFTGVGYGGNIMLTDAAAARGYNLVTDRTQPDLHQFYLQTLLEHGIPGLVAYLFLIGVLLTVGFQSIRHRPREETAAACAAFGALCGLLFAGLAYYFNEQYLAHLFWPVMGLLIAGDRSRADG